MEKDDLQARTYVGCRNFLNNFWRSPTETPERENGGGDLVPNGGEKRNWQLGGCRSSFSQCNLLLWPCYHGSTIEYWGQENAA